MTDKNAWGTPPYIVDRARIAMGSIDMDPASNENAQKVVQATNYCAPGRLGGWCDGLAVAWHGNVFLNPPYGRGLVEPFVRKLASEIQSGRVSSFVAITNLDPSTQWAGTLFELASDICLLANRVQFLHPVTGEVVRGNSRSQVVYCWSDYASVGPRFRAQFSTHGYVYSKASV